MKILITGSNGFVGSYLINANKSQHTIYGLDIVSPPKDGVVAIYAWDELEKLPEVDIIIHLAGKAHDTKNTSSSQSYFDINLGLTKIIFDYFLQSKTEKFIFFSSVKAVADTVQGEFLTEEDIPNPKTPYGLSKLAAEQYILSKKLSANKKVYILRPCMIHGPGNKGNLNLLYTIVSKGLPWPLGAFDNKRSFLSIDNLCFVIQKILQDIVPPDIYNLADNEALSTNNIVTLIADEQNRRPIIWHLPNTMIHILAKMGNILYLPLNEDRLQKLTENYLVSNKKIIKALGEPLPINLIDGMIKTIRSFKNKKSNY